jgi:hypothetical protein
MRMGMIILRNYAAPAASPVTPSLSISLPMMPAWCTWHRTVSHHQRLDKTRRAIGRSQSKRGRTKPETPPRFPNRGNAPETGNRKPETGKENRGRKKPARPLACQQDQQHPSRRERTASAKLTVPSALPPPPHHAQQPTLDRQSKAQFTPRHRKERK